MNEFYIVDGQTYEVAPNRKQEFLSKFPNAILKQEAKTTGVEMGATAPPSQAPTTESVSEPGLLESLAARTARGFVSTLKGVSSAKDALIFNMYNLFDPDMTTEEKKGLYDSIESFNMPGLGFFSTDNLESAEEYLSKHVRENGQSVLQEFQKGDYGSAAEAIVGGALESIPSLLAAFTGYGGIALFGASVAGNKFDEEFEANPEESLGKLSLNAVGSGAIEAGFELVTRGLGKSLKLIPGEQTAKQAAKQLSEGATKAIFKKLGGAYAAEGASEAATEVTSIIYDKITLDKDINAGEAITRAVDAFAIGGFVGGALGTVSAIGDRTTAARARAEFILAPIEYKEKTIAAAVEMSRLQKALQNEETEEGREIIKKQIQDIEDKVVKAKQANSINLRYLKGDQLSKYAENVDSMLKAEQVIKNEKSSQQAKDIAKNNIINLSKSNNEIMRQSKSQVANVNKEFAKKLSNDLGIEFNEVNSEEELQKITGEKIKREDNVGGVYFDGKIYWNKSVAEGQGDFIQVAAGSHEVLHPIINAHVLSKSNARELTDGVGNLLTKEQSRLVDEHLMQNYNAEKGSDLYYKEYFQAISDLAVENQINFDKTAFEKIKEFFQKLFGKYNVKAGFNNSEEILEFVKQYSASAKKGKKLSKNLVDVLDKQKIQSELLSENEILKSNKKDLKNVFDVFVQTADGARKYPDKQAFQNSRDQANAFNEIAYSNTLDGMIKNMAARDGITNIDVENVKENLSMRFIQNFDPSKNESLFGWITGNRGALQYAYLDEKKRVAQEQPTTSIDIESGEIGFIRELESEETEFELTEKDIQEQEAGIKPGDLLAKGVHQELVEKIDEEIDKLDIENLTFKTMPNLAAEYVSQYLGIPVSKILDPKKNLSTGEAAAAQKFIYENIDNIIKLLPNGAVFESASDNLLGTSTGVPKNLLKNFYEKDSTRRTEAQGLWEFKKLENINKEKALAAFGIMPDGRPMPGFSGRTPESQTIKALSNVLGKLATNSAVRDLLRNQGFNPNVIQDIAAGKSPAMFSSRKAPKATRSKKIRDVLSSFKENTDIEAVREHLSKRGFEKLEIQDFLKDYEEYLNNNREKNIHKNPSQNILDYLNEKDNFEVLNETDELKDVLGAYGYSSVTMIDKQRNKAGEEVLKVFYDPFFKKFTNNGQDLQNTMLFFKFLARPFSHGTSYSLFDGNEEIKNYFNKLIKSENFKLDTVKSGKEGKSLVLIDREGNIISNFSRVAYDSKKGVLKSHELSDFSETYSIYNDQAQQAKKDAKVFFTALSNFVKESKIDKEQLKQFKGILLRALNSIIKPSDSLLRLAAKPTIFLKYEGDYNSANYEFEHRPPISLIARYMASHLYSGDVSLDEVLSGIDALEGGFVPREVHKEINKTHKSTMQRGYRFGDNAWELYEKQGNKIKKIPQALKSVRTEKELESFESRMAAILSNMDKRYTAGQTLDRATAKNLAATRSKRRDILAPSADDFVGLLYRFLDKGKLGEEQYKFFEDNLIKPFSKAYYALNRTRQQISNSYKAINRANPEIVKKLKKDSGFGGFTFEQALRVWLFNKIGVTPNGLNEETKDALLKIVKNNPDIQSYGEQLSAILPMTEYWVDPDAKNWQVDTIKSDMVTAVEKVSRKAQLQEWIENKKAIFSDNNMNKIEATYGPDFRAALEDMLYRMENGTARPEGTNKQMNQFLNWIRGSVAVTMFFNTRSAILQQVSLVNFINWGDNNPIKAAMALANVDQYAKDWAFIFNSDYLKERRGGLKTDVNAADLADAIKKGGVKGLHARLLQLGFSLTQIGDSIAIATGGATFLRNRTNTYISQGLSLQEAEQKAFLDFQEISEESQQSARPDRLAKQQTDVVGRVFLAFQNTPMQYTRIIVKAAKDLAAGRGDRKTNISKIVHYMVVQNIVFSAMQQALFSMLFDDEEDEKEAEVNQKKVERIINNSVDTVLRGTGMYGAILATAKNTILKFAEQEARQEEGRGRADHAYTMIEAFNISPAIGIKSRELYGSIQNYRYNKDIIDDMGVSINNPALDIAGSASAFALNIPLDRAISKVRNLKAASDAETETWAKIALALGWNTWNVGIENKELEEVKTQAKKQRKTTTKKREAFVPKTKKSF